MVSTKGKVMMTCKFPNCHDLRKDEEFCNFHRKGQENLLTRQLFEEDSLNLQMCEYALTWPDATTYNCKTFAKFVVDFRPNFESPKQHRNFCRHHTNMTLKLTESVVVDKL